MQRGNEMVGDGRGGDGRGGEGKGGTGSGRGGEGRGSPRNRLLAVPARTGAHACVGALERAFVHSYNKCSHRPSPPILLHALQSVICLPPMLLLLLLHVCETPSQEHPAFDELHSYSSVVHSEHSVSQEPPAHTTAANARRRHWLRSSSSICTPLLEATIGALPQPCLSPTV